MLELRHLLVHNTFVEVNLLSPHFDQLQAHLGRVLVRSVEHQSDVGAYAEHLDAVRAARRDVRGSPSQAEANVCDPLICA